MQCTFGGELRMEQKDMAFLCNVFQTRDPAQDALGAWFPLNKQDNLGPGPQLLQVDTIPLKNTVSSNFPMVLDVGERMETFLLLMEMIHC